MMRIQITNLANEPRSSAEVWERAYAVRKRIAAQRMMRKPKPVRTAIIPPPLPIPEKPRSPINPRTNVKMAMYYIIAEVAHFYELDVKTLLSEDRTVAIARPRMVAMWATRQLIPATSLPKIGRHFRRDHTSVLNAVRKITQLRERDPAMHESLDALLARLAAKFV